MLSLKQIIISSAICAAHVTGGKSVKITNGEALVDIIRVSLSSSRSIKSTFKCAPDLYSMNFSFFQRRNVLLISLFMNFSMEFGKSLISLSGPESRQCLKLHCIATFYELIRLCKSSTRRRLTSNILVHLSNTL